MPSDYLTLFEERRGILVELSKTLDELVRQDLEGTSHVDRISFRVKDPLSFEKKALAKNKNGQQKYQNPLREIEDQIAGRVIVFFLSDIEKVRSALASTFRQVEFEAKEPDSESAFGYQSHHQVFLISEHHKPAGWGAHKNMPKTFELQIRTLFMHAWAEPQHDIGYKGQDELTKEMKRMLAWVAASAWGADRSMDEIARKIL
jgi:putative GTP pyrophosphokinase